MSDFRTSSHPGYEIAQEATWDGTLPDWLQTDSPLWMPKPWLEPAVRAETWALLRALLTDEARCGGAEGRDKLLPFPVRAAPLSGFEEMLKAFAEAMEGCRR